MPTETLDRSDSQTAVVAQPESTPAVTPQAQPNDDRKLFDSIVRKHGAEDSAGQPKVEQATPASGEQGNPKEAATEPSKGQPVTLSLTDKAKEYATALGIKADDQNALVEAAIEAFKRDKVLDEDEIVEKWQRDPAKFIEAGLKIVKRQKDTDSYGGEFREFQKNPEAFIEKYLQSRGQQQQQANPAPLPPLPERVNAKITQALTGAKFVNELGEFDQEAFQESFGITLTSLAEEIAAEQATNLQALQQQHTAEIQKRDADIEGMRLTWVDQQLEQARSQLAKQYPDIANPETWKRVLEEPGGYDDLANTGKFSVSDAVARAARSVLGEETTQSLRNRLLTEHSIRKDGQAMRPSSSISIKEPSKVDRDRADFDRIFKQHMGKSANEL